MWSRTYVILGRVCPCTTYFTESKWNLSKVKEDFIVTLEKSLGHIYSEKIIFNLQTISRNETFPEMIMLSNAENF